MRVLICVCGALAFGFSGQSLAQGGPPKSAVTAAATAPVGHRQPRATDVPPGTTDKDPVETLLDNDQKRMDKVMRSICRGC